MKILRNNAHIPGQLNGLQAYVDNFTSTGGGAIVLETRINVILFAKAFATDGTFIDGVSSASTTYPGAQKVTFTAVAGKVYQMLVVGSNGYSTTLGTVAAGATIDDPEVY